MFRPSLRRLYASTLNPSPSSILSKQPPLAILPPIPLYRRLLRAHRRKLDPESRAIGDNYVKDEWRRHRDIENPLHIIGFLTEWQLYAQALEGDSWRGEKLDPGKLEKMSDEQVGQLYELMTAIRKRSLGEEEEEGGRGEGEGEGSERGGISS